MALSEIARHRCDWDDRCGHYAIHPVMMKIDSDDWLPSSCRLCETHMKEAEGMSLLYDRTSFRKILPDGTLGPHPKQASTETFRKRNVDATIPEKRKFKSKFPQPMPLNWKLGDPISLSTAWRDDDLEIKTETPREEKFKPPEKKESKKRTKRARRPAKKVKQTVRRTYTRNPKGERLTERVLVLLAKKPWQTSKEIRESLDGYAHMSGLLGLLKRQEKISRLPQPGKQSVEGARYALKGTPPP